MGDFFPTSIHVSPEGEIPLRGYIILGKLNDRPFILIDETSPRHKHGGIQSVYYQVQHVRTNDTEGLIAEMVKGGGV